MKQRHGFRLRAMAGLAISLLVLPLPAVDLPYREALPGYAYQFPRDHFEHEDFHTEWWYYTGNVRGTHGERFGFELVFFRQGVKGEAESKSVWAIRDLYLAHAALTDVNGERIQFPKTPEEWTEQRWVDYSCHADAPWVSEKLRRRIQNFVTVLGCRFPTVQDVRSPSWAKTTLRALATWRYALQKYDRPWELALSKKIVRLADPRVTSI